MRRLLRLGWIGLLVSLLAWPVHAQVVGGGGGGGGSSVTEYDEDSPHTSTNPGIFPLTVRSDAGGSLCGADGDYCPFQVDSNGALRVTGGGGGTEYNTNDPAPANPVGTSLLMERTDTLGSTGSEINGDWTNARSTSQGALWTSDVNSAAILTALQLIDNIPNTLGSTTSGQSGVLVLGAVTTSAPTYTTAQSNAFSLQTDGSLRIHESGTATVSGTVTVTDGAGALNVIVDSGTITAVTSITNALPAGTNLLGKVGIDQTTPGTTNLVQVTDGAGALNVIVDSLPTVTVTDGAGALNVIVDSGTITTVSAVTAITNALPAGTNAIGKLSANSGVDIGDVDVTSIVPGTAATSLGKAVDSVAGATDTGVAMLAVRDDALATLTPADGDYTHLRVNSTGALYVTGGGGGTQYNLGDVPTAGTLAMVIRDDALTTLASADGQAVAMRVDSVGSLHVTIDSIAAAAGTATVTEDGSIPAGATSVTEIAAVLYCNDGTNPVHCAYTTGSGLLVNVSAVVPGAGATNLGKAEDAPHTSGDVGVAALCVRKDTSTTGLGVNGDYANCAVDSNGAIYVTGAGGGSQYVEDVPSAGNETMTLAGAVRQDGLASSTTLDGDYAYLKVDANGSLYVTGGGGGTQYTTGATATTDPIGTTMVCERDDVLGTLGGEADGDISNCRLSAEGALWTQDFNSDAILAALVSIAGTVTATELRVDVIGALPAGTNVIGHVIVDSGTVTTVSTVTALTTITNAVKIIGNAAHDAAGAAIDPIATACYANAAAPADVSADVDITREWCLRNGARAIQPTFAGVLQSTGNGVAGTGTPRVTIASDNTAISVNVGTFPANQPLNVAQINGVTPLMGNGATGTGALRVSLASDSTGIVAANGTVAHDSADAGAPVKIGAKAIAFGSNPTGVTAADRTDLYANRAGIPFVLGGHPNTITISAQIQDADNGQTDLALVSVAGGAKIVVTRITASCDGSTTGPTNLKVGFGAATLPASAHTGVAGILHEFDGIPAGGGFTIGDGAGVLGVGADGEDLRYTIDDPVGGNCSLSVSYFTIES